MKTEARSIRVLKPENFKLIVGIWNQPFGFLTFSKWISESQTLQFSKLYHVHVSVTFDAHVHDHTIDLHK